MDLNTKNYRKTPVIVEVDMPRKPKSDGAGRTPARQVVEDRLYTVALEDFEPSDLSGVTVLVNLGAAPGLELKGDGTMDLSWDVENNADEHCFAGIIRLISSSMKGIGQRVLLVGSQETVDTVSACVLREYMGCSARVALTILRDGHPKCLSKRELAETVIQYKPS